MYLVQILLPLTTNDRKRLPQALYLAVQKELTDQFHGLTAFSRAPAEGLWKPRKGTKRDDIVVYEVMTESIDEQWWAKYRKRLEELFQQESIVIRAQEMRVL